MARTSRIPRRPGRDRRREPVPGPVEGSVIRPAVQDDVATIIALRALMFEAMGVSSDEVLETTWQQDASRWIQLHLSDPRLRIMVAEANGTVVSCAMGQVVDLMPSPSGSHDGGRISNVATFPRHRRLGFTRTTVEALLDWFREETEVGVVSINATQEGRAMYEKFGFADVTFPEMRLHLDRPADGED
ncbi:GNAT family N-acetyltransferase [Janibacter cremeus]|uniref:Ribosomal protein S18 acetylase RimI-like enzyme n=1 Tax=Janibacter cremeus TaxID=1285192 RepID=A0A852VRM4_9MICO|nr:GNAT family N-acetyltransferase [Janibacter cremeus]NYF97353.1 ribosomal protein S18 acetylase RimI-like enzyme [Janibacter cremeus]